MVKKKKAKKKTQKQNVLEYLQSGSRTRKGKTFFYKTITPIEALNRFGSFRLSAIIFDLKADGYIFEDVIMVKNAYGNSFAQYKLASIG